MGEPILKASDVPTKLLPNIDRSVVKSELKVDGVTWNVTCVSMGNPHCVTFGAKGEQVIFVDSVLYSSFYGQYSLASDLNLEYNNFCVTLFARKNYVLDFIPLSSIAHTGICC